MNWEIPDHLNPPRELIDAAESGRMIMFVGAGASLPAMPTWKSWAEILLSRLIKKGVINYSDRQQLLTLDVKKQVSIARMIAEAKKVDLELSGDFIHQNGTESPPLYQILNEIGCSCVTTNYDEYLCPRVDSPSEAETPAEIRRYHKNNDIMEAHLRKPGAVIHLHGCCRNERGMIVSTREYLEHYEKPHIHAFLRELFNKYTVLFIGYGLEESEILEHMLRKGGARRDKVYSRFMLFGHFRSEESLSIHLESYYRDSFGVQLIRFSKDEVDFARQVDIMEDWLQKIKVSTQPSSTMIADIKRLANV